MTQETKAVASVIKKEFYAPLKTDWVAQSGLSEADFQKEVSFAIQHAVKNPTLQQCERTSILRAVANLAQVGLTLNPILKLAYLVPRFNRASKQMECVLEPDYRGLCKLLTDSGAVKSISAKVVYENDEVEIDEATEQKVIKHVPHWLLNKPKGKIVAVYSLAILADDSRHMEGMSITDVHEIRDRSESYKAFVEGKIKSCIWVSDEAEMCRKTVIKRHSKYLPKSAKIEAFEKAVDLDNQVHGFREPIDYGMMQFLEGLIHNSTLDPEKKEKMMKEMSAFEFKEQAYPMIDVLKECQPIVGRDYTPHTIKEQGEAIRNAADLDDFKEQRKNK